MTPSLRRSSPSRNFPLAENSTDSGTRLLSSGFLRDIS